MRFRQSSRLWASPRRPAGRGRIVAQSSPLHTAVLRDWEAFEALRGDWNRLLGRSGADAVF
jgi:hypothetical protein